MPLIFPEYKSTRSTRRWAKISIASFVIRRHNNFQCFPIDLRDLTTIRRIPAVRTLRVFEIHILHLHAVENRSANASRIFYRQSNIDSRYSSSVVLRDKPKNHITARNINLHVFVYRSIRILALFARSM